MGLQNENLLNEVTAHAATYHAYQSKPLLVIQCFYTVKAVIYNTTEQTI